MSAQSKADPSKRLVLAREFTHSIGPTDDPPIGVVPEQRLRQGMCQAIVSPHLADGAC